jgi:hypothetical protein
MANKKLPVFITETGWDKDVLGEDKVAEYYKTAFQTVWNDSSVVAVTPFLLRASAGPFEKFSILPATGSDSTLFKTISALPKTLGSPSLTPQVLAAEIADIRPASVKAFPKPTPKPTKFTPGDVLRSTVKWIFKL